jgi:hypothetical protein
MVDTETRYRMLTRLGFALYALVCLLVFIWLRFLMIP